MNPNTEIAGVIFILPLRLLELHEYYQRKQELYESYHLDSENFMNPTTEIEGTVWILPLR